MDADLERTISLAKDKVEKNILNFKVVQVRQLNWKWTCENIGEELVKGNI